MLEFTSPSQTNGHSQLFFEPEVDGTFRFCVDYPELKSVTESDLYPNPGMHKYIEPSGDVTTYPTLDANSSHWKVEISKGDRVETLFAS